MPLDLHCVVDPLQKMLIMNLAMWGIALWGQGSDEEQKKGSQKSLEMSICCIQIQETQ